MRSSPWLLDGHSQTIFPALFARKPIIHYQRERWDTPDGDFIDLDWLAKTKDARDQPLVVLFHGLEGSSQSHYALALMARCQALGWRAVVCHFRGCSGEPNRLARAYHSGDSAEARWIIARLRNQDQFADAIIYAVGISLGANMLGKYLGESADAAISGLNACALVSAPLNLAASAKQLTKPPNGIYMRNFLKTLKQKSLEKWERFPRSFDKQRMLTAKSFFDFDDAVTAPLHGFASAQDYWEKSSCDRFLADIATPSLMINARNDPFLPDTALVSKQQVSAQVHLEQPSQGGHVGFYDFEFGLQWLPQRITHFLAEHG